jgi:hypothetical protein
MSPDLSDTGGQSRGSGRDNAAAWTDLADWRKCPVRSPFGTAFSMRVELSVPETLLCPRNSFVPETL